MYWGPSRTQAFCKHIDLSQQAWRMPVITPPTRWAKWGWCVLLRVTEQNQPSNPSLLIPAIITLSWQRKYKEWKTSPRHFLCFLGISHNVYSGRGQKCWWEWVLGMHFNYLLFSLQTQIIKIFWSIQSGKLPNLSSLPKGKKKDLEWILHLIVYNWIGIWTNHPSGFYLFLWCGWRHCHKWTW